MRKEQETSVRQGFSAKADRVTERFLALTDKRTRRHDPVRAERLRLQASVAPNWNTPSQLLKTLVAVLLWLMFSGVHTQLIAPYIAYASGHMMLNALAMSSAILLHLWPPKTPPWRTLFWLVWVTGTVGSALLVVRLGSTALTAATLAGFGFVLLRMNQNGRKLVRLARDWRASR